MMREAEAEGLIFSPARPPVDARVPRVAPVVHHEVRGLFALMPPRLRRAVREPDRLRREILETFSLHASALDRVVSGELVPYRYCLPVNDRLRAVDERSLHLHFASRYSVAGPNGRVVPPAWLAEVHRGHVAQCAGVVRTFLRATGRPSDDEQERCKRAFCLWALTAPDEPCSAIREHVRASLPKRSGKVTAAELDALVAWTARLAATASWLRAAARELPPGVNAEVAALSDAIERQRKDLSTACACWASTIGLRTGMKIKAIAFKTPHRA